MADKRGAADLFLNNVVLPTHLTSILWNQGKAFRMINTKFGPLQTRDQEHCSIYPSVKLWLFAFQTFRFSFICCVKYDKIADNWLKIVFFLFSFDTFDKGIQEGLYFCKQTKYSCSFNKRLKLCNNLHLLSCSLKSDLWTSKETGQPIDVRDGDANWLLDQFCRQRRSRGPHFSSGVEHGGKHVDVRWKEMMVKCEQVNHLLYEEKMQILHFNILMEKMTLIYAYLNWQTPDNSSSRCTYISK